METNPIVVLIEEMKSPELLHRLHALENLNIIANALGKDRTIDELLPFLSGTIKISFLYQE